MNLDYETVKKLEEAWLVEMASTKAEIIKELSVRQANFKIHVAKCFLFRKTEYYEHWLKEAANYCIKCDDLRLKPKAKRPSKNLFLQYFVDEEETAQDAIGILETAIALCPKINRDPNATRNEAFIFVDFWNDLRLELADYLANENTYEKSVYQNIINEYINKYPID